jgi:DNA primase catalytic core
VSDASFRQFVDRLKETVSIEDVVRARVSELKRAGAEWKARCPFHDEKTPSFHVVPHKGLFHCFGCGKSGDVIAFVEAFDGLSFMEAVEELATSVGLDVPRRERGASREDARRERLYEALERATKLYRKKLLGPEGAAARRYLDERGLELAVTEAFGLGWAPADGRTLVEAARSVALVGAGLVKRPEGGGEPFDFFRGRLIVPIRDVKGRTIGFGGRVLPGTDGPKYLNTAETELFQKGHLVFGLDLAAETARRERHLVLMEGYTDVIAAHQAGLRQAVAVLGTATTEHHARLLRRTGAQRLTLVFDGDAAGHKAAVKALRGLLPRGEFETIDALALPDGQDPCDMLVERGSGARGSRGARFMALMEKPTEWFEFLVGGIDRTDPQTFSDSIDEVLTVLAVLPNPVEREARMALLAERTGVSASSVAARFAALAPARGRAASPAGERGAHDRAALTVGERPAGDRHAADRHATRGGRLAPGTPSAPAAPLVEAPLAASPSASAHVTRSEHAPRNIERQPDRRDLEAWADLVGAALVDNGLVALFKERFDSALEGRGPRHAGLMVLLETLYELYEEDEAAHAAHVASRAHAAPLRIDASRVGTVLGLRLADATDDPTLAQALDAARRIAVQLEQRASKADDVRALATGAHRRLSDLERERRTAETLEAAARGADPELARLEAANRVFRPSARGSASL